MLSSIDKDELIINCIDDERNILNYSLTTAGNLVLRKHGVSSFICLKNVIEMLSIDLNIHKCNVVKNNYSVNYEVHIKNIPKNAIISIKDTPIDFNNDLEIIKSWFKLLFKITIQHKLIPKNLKAEDFIILQHNVILPINYSNYEQYNVVDIIKNTNDVVDTGYILNYKNDNTVDKIINETNEKIQLNVCDYNASLLNAEFIIIDDLINSFNEKNSMYNIFYEKYKKDALKLFDDALTSLNTSNNFKNKLLTTCLNNKNINIISSVKNWLGGGDCKYAPSHRILTWMRINPSEFKEFVNSININELRKLNIDEFTRFIFNSKFKDIKYIRLVRFLYMGYLPEKEFEYLHDYITNNKLVINKLYRYEITNRFNDVKNGDVVEWNNIIATSKNLNTVMYYLQRDIESKQYEGTNCVLKFVNSPAALLLRPNDVVTTYLISYNKYDKSDRNPLRFNAVYEIQISNEYIIQNNIKFKVLKVKFKIINNINVKVISVSIY